MPDRWQAHGRRKEIAQIPLSSGDLSRKEDRCPDAGPPRRRISVCSLAACCLSHIFGKKAPVIGLKSFSGRAMSCTGLNPWLDTGMLSLGVTRTTGGKRMKSLDVAYSWLLRGANSLQSPFL